MTAYYNEIDPHAVEVLKQLISIGAIADGVVDNRDIRDVKPSDLTEFTQCHFFAGIGGWSLALRLAGWSDERPVWTGSCPCQPFSAAGRGSTFTDERHLWPAWYHLLGQSDIAVVFGEQVASKAGRAWLDLVQTDLEALGYRSGSADLCAASVGAPHIRQRAWFVGLADANDPRLQGSQWIGEAGSEGSPVGHSAERSAFNGVADTNSEGRDQGRKCLPASRSNGTIGNASLPAAKPVPRPTNGFWRDADWLYGQDGKWRAVKPGSFPLANGLSSRVGTLREYGNAIVPQLAQEFIEAVMEEIG